MYDDFKVKKNIHSNCLIEIKYEQVNIIINERKKINRQYKIIHLEILLKVQYRYRDTIISPEYRSCGYIYSHIVNLITIQTIYSK